MPRVRRGGSRGANPTRRSNANGRNRRTNIGSAQSILPKGKVVIRKNPPLQVIPALRITEMWVSGESIQIPVTTGLVEEVVNLSTSNIQNFTTRFAAIFQEYIILKVRVTCIPRADEANSFSAFLYQVFDELDSTVLGNVGQAENASPYLWTVGQTSSQDSIVQYEYRTNDLLDLDYTDTGSTKTVGYFKLYGSSTDTGVPMGISVIGVIKLDFFIRFRGVSFDGASDRERNLRDRTKTDQQMERDRQKDLADKINPHDSEDFDCSDVKTQKKVGNGQNLGTLPKSRNK